ncbi:Hypothetical_protein [Hexamita inflata]|uniref:Hypothetical_protein n=1 Tax=Hexamita inflata TaxID=28002 RepID=A0AA86R408_9EUKA|nr:Hypothetical protein HINF_LOCUS53377 [Hexamita inflata]
MIISFRYANVRQAQRPIFGYKHQAQRGCFVQANLRKSTCVSNEAMERLPLSNPEGLLMACSWSYRSSQSNERQLNYYEIRSIFDQFYRTIQTQLNDDYSTIYYIQIGFPAPLEYLLPTLFSTIFELFIQAIMTKQKEYVRWNIQVLNRLFSFFIYVQFYLYLQEHKYIVQSYKMPKI